MLERTLVFVDTSYLLASFYNSWEEGARTQLEIDLPEVCSVLDRMITQHVGQPVQRQNWYDGIPDSGPHRYQRALRTVDGVQLRAGLLIETGQRRTQKAVDTRLVADMILAAVRQQCSDMVLVSGDQDMIPGVVEASAMGVRVHLYGFSWDSMSNALRHKCDSITVLDPREDFADTMQIQPLEGPFRRRFPRVRWRRRIPLSTDKQRKMRPPVARRLGMRPLRRPPQAMATLMAVNPVVTVPTLALRALLMVEPTWLILLPHRLTSGRRPQLGQASTKVS